MFIIIKSCKNTNMKGCFFKLFYLEQRLGALVWKCAPQEFSQELRHRDGDLPPSKRAQQEGPLSGPPRELLLEAFTDYARASLLLFYFPSSSSSSSSSCTETRRGPRWVRGARLRRLSAAGWNGSCGRCALVQVVDGEGAESVGWGGGGVQPTIMSNRWQCGKWTDPTIRTSATRRPNVTSFGCIEVYASCIKSALSLLATRGWLLRLYRGLYNDSTSLLMYSLSKRCKYEFMSQSLVSSLLLYSMMSSFRTWWSFRVKQTMKQGGSNAVNQNTQFLFISTIHNTS